MNRSESKYFNTATKMDLALIALLKKKPFDYITVSDICREAGVNRSTFYLHYETVADLLNEATKYLMNDFTACFTANMEAAVDNLRERNRDELIFVSDAYLTPYLTYIREHKEVFGTAMSHNKILGFDVIYQWLFEKVFDPVLDRFHYPLESRRYVMAYYMNGIAAIVSEWLKNGCDKSVQEVAEIITVCIYGKNASG